MALRDRMLSLARVAHLPRRSVRFRLTLLYGLLFLLSGAALLTTTYFLVDAATGNAFIVQGKNGLTFAGFQIGSTPPGTQGSVALSLTGGPGHALGSGKHGTSSSSNGRVVPAGQKASGSGALVTGGPSSPGLKLTPAQMKRQRRQVAMMQQQLETLAHAYQGSELHQLLIESGVALAIMALLSGGLGWIVAGRVLRPLRTITASTREISASNLHERLAVGGPDDELKELGDTIDGLLERLEASFRSQRQFVANASHELRTPLARQRTLAQVALADPDATTETLRAAHERILASGAQQEQLIDALLTLTRSQAGTAVHQPLDLGAIVGELSAARAAESSQRELRVTNILQPAMVCGDPRLVERLVGNLLDNALRRNRPDGTVTVETGTGDGSAWLTVSNDGPVVPQREVERLYAPFERLEDERMTGGEGFGLGLCIVRAVATAHGAVVDTVARPEGGLRTEVRFPEYERAVVSGGPTAVAGPALATDQDAAEAGARPGEALSALVHASPSDH